MSGTERVRGRLESVQDLGAIVRAMKALSAVRIRQARQAVDSLHGYRETVELALQVALTRRPRGVRLPAREEGGDLAAVVFGSDLGLLGRFNARITDQALADIDELRGPDGAAVHVLAVGARAAAEIGARGGPALVRRIAAPGTVDAITPAVQEVLGALDELRESRGVERVVLSYNHYHPGARYRPRTMHLLPLNLEWLRGVEARPWEGPSIPAYRIPWTQLFSSAVQEYMFVSLFAAAAESHASEHAARLAAMETAEDRIEERERELTSLYHRRRKERITEELLDLMAGFSALQMDDEDGGSEGGAAAPGPGSISSGPA